MNSKKTIWFISQYASTPENGIAGRQYYLGKQLAKLGFKVYVIVGSYSHLLHTEKNITNRFLVEEHDKDFYYVWTKLPSYSHAHSPARIINEFKFTHYIKQLKDIIIDKPDFIYHSSPALISFFGSSYLSNYYKVPYIFEVRDPWPLTLTMLGNYSTNHPFIKFLQWIEDRAYKKADLVIANFYNAISHMKSRGMNEKKFKWIPNGISLSELKNIQTLDPEIEKQIPSNKFIIGYTGTIGKANAMHYLIEAASLLRTEEKIHFVLVGNGKDKKDLIKQCNNLKLKNVTFIDPISKAQVQSMLSMFDACYIGWNDNPMYNLGIAANKIAEYMYSERPVIHSFSGSGDFIAQANAGITVEAENPHAIAAAILDLTSLDPIERSNMGHRGRSFVLKHLTYEKLALKLKDSLLSI